METTNYMYEANEYRAMSDRAYITSVLLELRKQVEDRMKYYSKEFEFVGNDQSKESKTEEVTIEF